ncbi:inositol monophosphatase family protein [Coprothermobacter platensis]|uniref:inositol monophosphatase family protein n=1 Tax=Coprothermobacter platensis TaxID=108819 RepID=UPI00039FA83D|nr:inositol monophosphatase family protein [Coprothermobacter platensis]
MSKWDAAIRVALKTGEILKEGFRTNFDIQKKGVNDLVTTYDLRAQSYIVEQLSKDYRGCGFFAEEDLVTEGDPLFVVDPLDGTNNFASGIPQFCVSIGVIENGSLQAGVVYNPVMEELFFSQKGNGAFLNERQIHINDKPLKNTLVATAFPFKERDKLEWFSNLFSLVYAQVMDIRRMGSAALDLTYTASSMYGLYFEYGINPWDVAAGVLMVQEAGGVVKDFSGQPFDLFHSKTILAGNESNVEEVLNIWSDKASGCS